MNNITPEEILRRIGNIPSLPAVVMELLATIDQQDVHVETLADKIEQDQALTARTLRLANSSFYGMACQITTIREAIAIVGFRTIRGLATTAGLMGTFAGGGHADFDAAPFWRHALGTAVCARELATHLNLDPGYAYIVGLIHDIGRLVLVTQFAPNFQATMAYRVQHDCSWLQAERAVLGLDHAAIGQALTRHWKFPEAMQQAVACHHATSSTGLLPLSLVVMAADAIAHALDLSSDEGDAVPSICPGLWVQLGLTDASLLDVFAATEKQFQVASAVLRN
jgi:putative nucleotidyltransferase with HDIG domain